MELTYRKAIKDDSDLLIDIYNASFLFPKRKKDTIILAVCVLYLNIKEWE